MKLLIDQNLSRKLSGRLQDLFPGSVHLREVISRRAPDNSIWSYARSHEFTVLTKDTDYLRISEVRGYPPKLIWIGLGNCPTESVESLLRDNYAEIEAFGQDPARDIIELR